MWFSVGLAVLGSCLDSVVLEGFSTGKIPWSSMEVERVRHRGLWEQSGALFSPKVLFSTCRAG